MWVERSQNSGQALGAADDKLRLLTVGRATALTPQTAFATRPVWTAAAPESVAPFSAACFYMVQALRQTSKVPIGAIHWRDRKSTRLNPRHQCATRMPSSA